MHHRIDFVAEEMKLLEVILTIENQFRHCRLVGYWEYVCGNWNWGMRVILWMEINSAISAYTASGHCTWTWSKNCQWLCWVRGNLLCCVSEMYGVKIATNRFAQTGM